MDISRSIKDFFLLTPYFIILSIEFLFIIDFAVKTFVALLMLIPFRLLLSTVKAV